MGVIFTVDYRARFAEVRGSQKVIVAIQSALKCHCAPLGNSFLLRLLNTDFDNIMAARDALVIAAGHLDGSAGGYCLTSFNSFYYTPLRYEG